MAPGRKVRGSRQERIATEHRYDLCRIRGAAHILYYGKPWSGSKALIDDATGLEVEIGGGCAVSKAFVAEVDAYNAAVRVWHAKKPADDNELLVGTWKLTEMELAGNPNPPGPEEKCVIGKGKIKWTGGIRPVTLSYTIDATKTPKQIDMEIVEGELGTGGKLKGIYKLTEGKLQVCYFINPEKDERPKEFAGTDTLGKPLPEGPVFLILRRVDDKKGK